MKNKYPRVLINWARAGFLPLPRVLETTLLAMLPMQPSITHFEQQSQQSSTKPKEQSSITPKVTGFGIRFRRSRTRFFFLTEKINRGFIVCLPFSSNLWSAVSRIQFKKMRIWWCWLVLAVLVSSLEGSLGIRFVIDREECISHKVEIGATVHFSFVVIKSDRAWHYNEDGVDLVVKGPNGEQIQDFRDKISEKSEFPAHHEGVYRFCFTNKSPYHETIDFDILAGYFVYHDEHAKDEHFKPLFEHIGKLEEALYNIQFEQHWLESQTERQAIVNEGMSRRAIHKALYESAALIGASVLQVYLLRRLFERKIGLSRV